MSDLHSQIQEAVDQFVSSIYSAVRAASLSQLVEEAGAPREGVPARRGPGRPPKIDGAVRGPARAGRAGRRKRASSEEVQHLKDMVLSAARQLKPGFSKGDVMKRSRSRTDLGRALALVVADGKLIKKGDRRLTRYWLK
jgi:hypothetical protein